MIVADNGSIHFWDWKSGFCFQREQTKAQPGSIDSEAGIFAMTFDRSVARLITAEADKTIKMYKEDDTAVSSTSLFFVFIQELMEFEKFYDIMKDNFMKFSKCFFQTEETHPVLWRPEILKRKAY